VGSTQRSSNQYIWHACEPNRKLAAADSTLFSLEEEEQEEAQPLLVLYFIDASSY
jgi:hypothetical protein